MSLTWSFSYANSEVISQGPWNARGVQEIIFGTWKPIADGIYLDEKIAAVYSNGTFKARDGYGRDELDWNWSKYKLTFTIKSFTLQDQAKYGINVEFSSAQKSLKDTVDVKTGASYTGQDANSTVRNGKQKWYSKHPRTSENHNVFYLSLILLFYARKFIQPYKENDTVNK